MVDILSNRRYNDYRTLILRIICMKFKLIEIHNGELFVDSEYYGRVPRSDIDTPIRFAINFLGVNNTENLPVKIIIDGQDRTIECRSYIRRNLARTSTLPSEVVENIYLQMRRSIPYIEP